MVTFNIKIDLFKIKDKKKKLGTQQNNKIMLLDFYADWCISCKDLDNTVFSDPEVKKELQSLHVVRADVTSNDMMDKAIQERFNVIAPPTMLFFKPPNIDLRIDGTPGRQKTFSTLNPGAPLVGFKINFASFGIQIIFCLPKLNSPGL